MAHIYRTLMWGDSDGHKEVEHGGLGKVGDRLGGSKKGEVGAEERKDRVGDAQAGSLSRTDLQQGGGEDDIQGWRYRGRAKELLKIELSDVRSGSNSEESF